MGFLLGFLPWILYWILVGNIDFQLAICIALAVAIAVQAVGRLRKQPWRSLEVGSLIIFALLAVTSFLVSDAVLEQWLQPLSNLGLLLVALIGVLVGRPFVREYAAGSVDAETAKGDGFRYLTTAMTWMWVIVFALMTVVSAIPPVVDGNASNQDQGSLLSVLCYWVLPYVLLGVAGVISAVFPKWFHARSALIDKREVAEEPVVAAPPGAPADVTDGPVSIAVPVETLHDEPLPIKIEGAPARSRVALSVAGVDLFGRSWRAEATYEVPASGALDVSGTAPVSGDWDCADGSGPLPAMRFASPDHTPDLFVPPMDPWLVTVAVDVPGVGQAQQTVRRRAARPGVGLESVTVNGLPAVLARPDGPTPPGGWPAVACFGGSEGGFSSQIGNAGWLASHGYVALAACWIPEEDAAHQIVAVPLERFSAALAQLRATADVDPARMAAMAISRGAEGLLAALSRLDGPAPAALVLVSPSSVTWQGMGGEGSVPDAPSWTAAGQPVPWLPVPTGSLMPQLIGNAWEIGKDTAAHRPTLLRLRPAYAAGLQHRSASDRAAPGGADAAAIDARAVSSRLLVLTGADDDVWPSEQMARELIATRNAATDQHRHYSGAGHLIRFGNLPTDAQWTGGIRLGGTRTGQAAAQRDAVEGVLAFLGETLSSRPEVPAQTAR